MHQILLIAAIIGILIFIKWVSKQPKQKQFQSIAILVAIIVIGLVATGRAHWLFALFAAIVPMFQRILGLLSYAPLFGKLFIQFRNMQSGTDANQQSNVETEYLNMTLDHATGVMIGIVKKGTHASKNLDRLSMSELIDLYKEYAQLDTDSAQLLEAFLDRKYQDTWREKVHVNEAAPRNSNMTAEEAYNILGLDSDSTEDDIIEAHRRLMQKLHPDRGGNDYLASKINQAKDFLLKQTA